MILTSLFDWCSTSQTWNFFWISLIWDTVTLQSVSDSLTSESIKEVRRLGSRWQRLTRVRDNLFSWDVPFPSTILDINISIWESPAEKPNVLWNVKLSKQVRDSLKRVSEMCSKLKPSTSKEVCVLHIYELSRHKGLCTLNKNISSVKNYPHWIQESRDPLGLNIYM